MSDRLELSSRALGAAIQLGGHTPSFRGPVVANLRQVLLDSLAGHRDFSLGGVAWLHGFGNLIPRYRLAESRADVFGK